MKILNRFFAPAKSAAAGEANNIATWSYWPYLLGALILLLIIAGLFYYIKKHRKIKKDGAPEKKTPEKGMPISSLVKVWKNFMHEMPAEFRRVIMVYQHFVVLGEAGAGKGHLINGHTDWQGHARQFYPSYTTNPLLKIYLGSKILVQEIPAALLNDTTSGARKALIKLWKPLFKRKDPTVVIVLNSSMLQAANFDFLKKEAQMIRGKINLLARIRKKPVDVRIALTNMEQFDGFIEFVQFINVNNIPLNLTFTSKDELKELVKCLEPYEDYFTLALTSLPADSYLKAITFIREVPDLFKILSEFITVLQSPDPLTPEPRVVKICLAFRSDGQHPVSYPFATSLTAGELQKFNPLFKHRVAAGIIGVAGIIYLIFSFVFEHYFIEKKFNEIASIEESKSLQYHEGMRRFFVDSDINLQQHPIIAFLPDFYPHINKEINRRCVENIRKFYLLPELEKLTAMKKLGTGPIKEIQNLKQQYINDDANAQNKVLYLLGLFYATKHNGLGKLVKKNIIKWSDCTGFPTLLIKDYVKNNSVSKEMIKLNVNDFNYSRSRGTVSDPQKWMVYFLKISKFYQQPFITKTELKKIQQDTDTFLNEIQYLERYDLSVKISDLLKEESPLGITMNQIAIKDDQIRQDAVKKFLLFVKQSNIKYPEVIDAMSLTDLHENLKVILHLNEQRVENDKIFNFFFAGERINFSSRLWDDLLNRSRITFFLRDFIRCNKHKEGLLFFSAEKEFDDLIMNPSNDGQFFFTGHARVDGRFTKDAFEQKVKPVLTEFPVFIKTLPIPKKDTDKFLNFLFKESEAYGSNYAEAYRNYYMDFDIEATSLGALRYILTQLALPASQFMEILLTVKENTAIEPGENEYLNIIALGLKKFEFFQRLLAEKKSAHPELDKYKALLDLMEMDIDRKIEPKNKGGTSFTKFRNRLSPLGKISFAILRDEEDSYMNMVKLWLKSVGITDTWEDIFLAPICQAYFLGLKDIEDEIDKVWTDLLHEDIYPLYNNFPFNRLSNNNVSYKDLKKASHPYGHFWETYNNLLAPVCIKEDGIQKKISHALGTPEFPVDMLPTVNAIELLSASLWDKNGEEKLIEFMLKPVLLPSSDKNKSIAVLSYLQTGGKSIFGFNQQPAWKNFKVQWNNKHSASVGIELSKKDASEKTQYSLSVVKSPWNFYRLLQKTENFSDSDNVTGYTYLNSGDLESGNRHIVLTWPIPVGKPEENKTLNVKFAIKGDPWRFFNLPPR